MGPVGDPLLALPTHPKKDLLIAGCPWGGRSRTRGSLGTAAQSAGFSASATIMMMILSQTGGCGSGATLAAQSPAKGWTTRASTRQLPHLQPDVWDRNQGSSQHAWRPCHPCGQELGRPSCLPKDQVWMPSLWPMYITGLITPPPMTQPPVAVHLGTTGKPGRAARPFPRRSSKTGHRGFRAVPVWDYPHPRAAV